MMSAKGMAGKDAEQLLRGIPAGHSDQLAELLAAVAAPGTARELAGEEAAVATFRSALGDPIVVLGRNPSKRGSLMARRLTARAVGVALAVTAVGGAAAIAAGTAARPGPGPVIVPSITQPVDSPTRPPSDQPSQVAKAQPKPKPKPSTHRKAAKKKPKAPPPTLADLCRKFGKNLGAEEFDRLVNAAGGRQNILSFCSLLLVNKASAPKDHTPKDHRLDDWLNGKKKEWNSLFDK
ncbi:hypothetical protein [Actinocorallia lasiicapitis]